MKLSGCLALDAALTVVAALAMAGLALLVYVAF